MGSEQAVLAAVKEAGTQMVAKTGIAVQTAVHIVDAFTGPGLDGNPAAVCPLDEWLPDVAMQAIATKLALSETAFFAPAGDGYLLRWFTPATEVDLCGHATLASAAVVLRKLDPGRDAVSFATLKSGILTVARRDDLLEMDFPAQPAAPGPQEGVGAALGSEPAEILVIPGKACLAVFDSEARVRGLRPDMALVEGLEASMIIATAPGEDCDFASRCFAPRAGIPEDPVTGSAHTILTPYWSARLGKRKLHARQVSSRGGELFCEHRGSRVAIAGQATIRAAGSVSARGSTIEVQIEAV